MDRGRLIREAGFMKRTVEPVATPIAGKDSARTIAAMRRGCETNNQQAGRRTTEVGNRPAPVLPIGEGPPLFLSNLPAVVAQAGTALTGDDLAIQRLPG